VKRGLGSARPRKRICGDRRRIFWDALQFRSDACFKESASMANRLNILLPAAACAALFGVAFANLALADDCFMEQGHCNAGAMKSDAMASDQMSSDHMGSMKKPTTKRHAQKRHAHKHTKEGAMSSDHMSSDKMAPAEPKPKY
jgi:pentapeptide MXKDX repeat protein